MSLWPSTCASRPRLPALLHKYYCGVSSASASAPSSIKSSGHPGYATVVTAASRKHWKYVHATFLPAGGYLFFIVRLLINSPDSVKLLTPHNTSKTLSLRLRLRHNHHMLMPWSLDRR